MHCHCLLQMHLTTLEFPLLKTSFNRFPNRNIIYLCVYILYACDLFAQPIVCIVNVLQSEPPQCPALKMTKGQLTWIALTCNVVWHLNCFCTHLHFTCIIMQAAYELIYWNAWKFVLQNISSIIAWPFQMIARRRKNKWYNIHVHMNFNLKSWSW